MQLINHLHNIQSVNQSIS